MAYQLASSRQQLLIDTRPSNLKIFAEFLQAEAEELSTGVGTGVGQGKGPSLKTVYIWHLLYVADGSYTGELREHGAGDKDICRFWMPEKGRRRGDRCKYRHSKLSPKDNRRF